MQGYEGLLERFGTDFLQVDQQRALTDEDIAAFFHPSLVKKPLSLIAFTRFQQGGLVHFEYKTVVFLRPSG